MWVCPPFDCPTSTNQKKNSCLLTCSDYIYNTKFIQVLTFSMPRPGAFMHPAKTIPSSQRCIYAPSIRVFEIPSSPAHLHTRVSFIFASSGVKTRQDTFPRFVCLVWALAKFSKVFWTSLILATKMDDEEFMGILEYFLGDDSDEFLGFTELPTATISP